MNTFRFFARLGQALFVAILIVAIGVLAFYYFELRVGSPDKAQLAVRLAVIVAVLHFATQVIRTLIISRLSQPEGLNRIAKALEGKSIYSKHMAALGLSWVAGDRFGVDRPLTRAGRSARARSIDFWKEWLRVNSGRLVWDDQIGRYVEKDLLERVAERDLCRDESPGSSDA
jgi:hypothetical protein